LPQFLLNEKKIKFSLADLPKASGCRVAGSITAKFCGDSREISEIRQGKSD